MPSYQYRDSDYKEGAVGLIFITGIIYQERRYLYWDGSQVS